MTEVTEYTAAHEQAGEEKEQRQKCPKEVPS